MMADVQEAPESIAAPAVSPAPAREGQGGLRAAGQLVLAALALLGIVAAGAALFRPKLEALASAFVERFGAFGMGLGTFLADGFHCPVPPQFYMLAAIASGTSQVKALVAISAGSLLGGAAGYLFAGKLARHAFFARRLERSRRRVEGLLARRGKAALALGCVLPVPYSVLCYFSGIYRVPALAFFVFSLLRIPRLILYFALVRAGWTLGS